MGREEDEITAGEKGDERTDIRIGDEQIQGEVRGMKIGGRRRWEEHTDEAVQTDVPLYYSH